MISSQIAVYVVLGNFECGSWVGQLKDVDFIVICVSSNKLNVCLCIGFNMGKLYLYFVQCASPFIFFFTFILP